LEKWSHRKKYDRLGEGRLTFNILGKEMPMFVIPVAPGRNVSTLVEVAVKYYMSRKNGSKSFIEYLDEQQNESENG
ncbi:MAG: HPr kinase/phosphorylase, partial [Candidatus Aminicenantes bacterium]|nr:HPr kinase/phosphorylase [Candidatus Aminicenantes bacterium]